MRKTRYAFSAILVAVLVTSVAYAARTYSPSPSRPAAPAGKPSLIYPFTDSQVKLVSGFGTDTHNDVTFTTHTYYGLDFGTDNWDEFTVVAAAGGRLRYYSWAASLPSGVSVEERQTGCDEDVDPSTAQSDARTAVIDHGNGWRTIYMHLAQNLIPGADTSEVDVTAGTPIGIAGCSGAYWKHLHFELRHYATTTWSYDPQFTGMLASTQPSLDIAFLIDTTGSMFDDIDRVKGQATTIVNSTIDRNPNTRIAVMDFRDFPSRGASYDYPYRDALSFTYDRNRAIAAIQNLSLGFGGDYPETANCAIMHAIANSRCAGQGANTTLGPWASASKAIIVMTDAPALSPEPFTGFTTAQVQAQAQTGGFTFSLYGGGLEDEYGGDPPAPEGVAIYAVVIGGDSFVLNQYQELTDATGGQVFAAATAEDVVEAIMEALDVIIEPPVPAPTCESAYANPTLLWPPNNKLVSVTILGVENADTVAVTSVYQDEPTSTDADAADIAGNTVSIRAQRLGGGDGRVYHVNFAAVGPGGSCEGVARLIVPHDSGVGQHEHGTAVDGGPLYLSTEPSSP